VAESLHYGVGDYNNRDKKVKECTQSINNSNSSTTAI